MIFLISPDGLSTWDTGIGCEIIKAILPKNVMVYKVARSREKAISVIARLKVETEGKEAILLELDLFDLSYANE
ncbi:hypothetical protein F5879DRAFT_82881 [Lentinula edodes]|nr:hypothetical protein F5879DRAFT_82881 [Lentinula edodes]